MKASKKRVARRDPRALIESPPLVVFVDKPAALPVRKTDHDPKRILNGVAAKKYPNVQGRRYLRDMEIWLNNCVNFAERLQGEEAAKILRLLREARERTIKLRG